MACVRCGREISEDAVFCQHCGADQRAGVGEGKRLHRSRVDRQIGGVCGGIARYFDVDPVLVRMAWVILAIVPGAIVLGVLAYLVAWLIIPEVEPESKSNTTPGEGAAWRSRRLYRSALDAKIGGVCGASQSTSGSTQPRYVSSGSCCRFSRVRSSAACSPISWPGSSCRSLRSPSRPRRQPQPQETPSRRNRCHDGAGGTGPLSWHSAGPSPVECGLESSEVRGSPRQ